MKRNNIWQGGGVFGSLRKHVQHQISLHKKTNKALLSQKYSLGIRVVRALLGNGSLFRLLLGYLALVAVFMLYEFLLTKYFPDLLPCWGGGSYAANHIKDIKELLKDTSTAILSAQATMIGLIFPVAIGLVTLLVQRETGGSNADINIYYEETLARSVGASSLALTLIVTTQILWPFHFSFHLAHLGSENLIFKSLLTIFHILWFALNLIGLWHFLKASLDFVRPESRAKMRKMFTANRLVPDELQGRLLQNIYMNSPQVFLNRHEGTQQGLSVLFGIGSTLSSIPIVSIDVSRPVRLVDVRMRLLFFVLERWVSRLPDKNKTIHRYGSGNRSSLVFPPQLGKAYKGNIVLCAGSESANLTSFEKLLIKFSFCFKRERND